MLYELHDLPPSERDAHVAKWGDYNDYPPGWRRISESDFAQSAHFTWSPVLREHRQMSRNKPKGCTLPDYAVSAALEFQPDGYIGFALVRDFWKGTVEFYQFGCADPHHGQNHHRCSCGYEPHYDSSD